MNPDSHYPEKATTGHDLDPTGGSGDYVTTSRVERSQALVVAAKSTSGNTLSVSVEWVDADGNVFTSESKTDISMDSISDDWARLVRKGPRAKVTVTSEETDGTTNNANVWVDAHR